MAQLIDHLPSIKEAMDLILAPHKTELWWHMPVISTVQGYRQVHSAFEASLGSMKSYLENENWRKYPWEQLSLGIDIIDGPGDGLTEGHAYRQSFLQKGELTS